MEMEAILTASITIYCGVYYLTDSLDEGFSSLLFCFILLGNMYFLLHWLYYMMKAVIEFLSTLSVALQKLTGNMDPFPQYSQDCRYVKQGVFKNEEEGILKFTMISKSYEESSQADLKGFNEISDVYMKTYERYKEMKSEDLHNSQIINTPKVMDDTFCEEYQVTYVQTFNENDDMKSYEKYIGKESEESVDSQSIMISKIMDEEFKEEPKITFVRTFKQDESGEMSFEKLDN